MADIEKVYTLTELIIEGRQNAFLNTNYCKFLTIGDDILTVSGNILDKYTQFINDAKVKVKLTGDEFLKYKYRPKELSIDLYGTPEIAPIILKINNISHESEFTRKKIYVIGIDVCAELMNRIISINEDSVNQNHAEF